MKSKHGGSGGGADDQAASAMIDERIAGLSDWRGQTLAQARKLILQAGPGIVEEWKWGVPVWSQGGILCTGEVYKNAVKLTFAKGAALDDPTGMFNASLDGNTRRAIDFREGQKIDGKALQGLIRAAAAHNASAKAGTAAKSAAKKAAQKAAPKQAAPKQAAAVRQTAAKAVASSAKKSAAKAAGKTAAKTSKKPVAKAAGPAKRA